MITKHQLTLIIIVVFVIIVASNKYYFQAINKVYNTLKRMPKLVLIICGILSLFGINHIPFMLHKKPNYDILKHANSGNLNFGKFNSGKFNSVKVKRTVSDTTKKMIASKQQWKCGICNQLLDETYEVDHIIPLYQGGSNNIDNLMALDPICHRKKTNKDRLSQV